MAKQSDGERRVYVLPPELLARVRDFQTEHHLASEVEAVRRLLDAALQRRDTVEKLLDKLLDRSKSERDLRMLSREVLAPHPLVRSIVIDDEGNLVFRLENGDYGMMDRNLQAFRGETNYNNEDTFKIYPRPKASAPPAAKGSYATDLDDDIPF